jgi:hypothetical protein
VITDARGDTVRTLNGPASPGVHRVTWDFRGKAPPRAPLTISQRRDSIVQWNRINFVFDSLEKAGTMTKAQLDRIRGMIASGNPGFGRGGGAGRGGPTGWVARPGEGNIVGGGRGARGAAAAAGEGTPSGEESIQDLLESFPGGAQEFQELLRPPGQRGGGGFGGIFGFGGGRGNQAPVVNTGDYLVTLQVGGRTYKQVLRVERMSGGDDTGFNFGSDEDRDPRK